MLAYQPRQGTAFPTGFAVAEAKVAGASAQTRVEVVPDTTPFLVISDFDDTLAITQVVKTTQPKASSVIGRAFFVMEHVEGRILWDQALPEYGPAERAAIYDEMNRVIAALHSVDVTKAGLSDYGKAGNYFARQIGRWTKQYQASETETIEAMNRLIDWLPQHIPAGEDTAVVHGDYRLDNLIFHPTEPRILAILDWELSTIGHPLADFSYHLMSWHIAVDADPVNVQ